MFGTMRATAALLLLVGLVAPAHADDDDTRTAGVQDDPPSPEVEPDLDLDQQVGGRRAVRGCPVDHDCRPGHEKIRDFELEAFPPPGGDPWMDGDHADKPLVERATLTAPPSKPSELDPALAWMDDLELPDLPVRWDRRVIDYLLFYKEDERGRNIMEGWLREQGRYADMILDHLRSAKLPLDLLYVAMIESSYDPYEYSYAGASGLWQFMPEGGRIYGLEQNRWVDERNDPLRSTEAVLDYFADLHQRFGDWHLALAAFNAGYGAVIRSIARYNTNDFWQLLEYENGLPWEVSNYVPKALATAIVGHNREAFGFADVAARKPEAWDTVTVPQSVSLTVIAKAAGCTVADLKRLNPQLRRGRTPPGQKYAIRVPAGGGDKFATRFAQLRGDWDGYDAYVASHGERVEDIATQFGISRRKLMKLNELEHESDVTGGTVLVVPAIDEAERKKNLAKATENLYSSGVDQKKGEPLLVPVPDKDAEIAGKRRVFYRVVAGNSLAQVAGALDVEVGELAAWNDVEPDAKLQPRMVLQAWIDPDFDEAKRKVALLDESRIIVVTRGSTEHLDLAEERVGRVRVEYTAQGKESFEEIAAKYGLTARDLARINRRSYKTVLDKGDTIIVYQVVDKDRSERAREQHQKMPKKKSKKGKKRKKHDDAPVSTPDQLDDDDDA
jgi:membrane-bound lytic murein transglycosylase D